MTTFITTDSEQMLKELVDKINALTKGHTTTSTALLITPATGMEQTFRDLLTASGLQFHELNGQPPAARPAAQPAAKKGHGPSIKITSKAARYQVTTGKLAGQSLGIEAMQQALTIHDLAIGDLVTDRQRGEMEVSAYPQTKKLHLVRHQSKTTEETNDHD